MVNLPELRSEARKIFATAVRGYRAQIVYKTDNFTTGRAGPMLRTGAGAQHTGKGILTLLISCTIYI